MTGTEQTAKIYLPTTEIGGSVSIANTIRTDTENHKDPTIKPTITHLNQENRPGHSYWNHFPIRSLNIGIDVSRSGRSIDNHTEMNPKVPIVNSIPESNKYINFDIFDLVNKTSDLAYRGFPWHVKTKSKIKNLV